MLPQQANAFDHIRNIFQQGCFVAKRNQLGDPLGEHEKEIHGISIASLEDMWFKIQFKEIVGKTLTVELGSKQLDKPDGIIDIWQNTKTISAISYNGKNDNNIFDHFLREFLQAKFDTKLLSEFAELYKNNNLPLDKFNIYPWQVTFGHFIYEENNKFIFLPDELKTQVERI